MSRPKSTRRVCADVKAASNHAADRPNDAARQIASLIFLVMANVSIVFCGIKQYDVSHTADFAFIPLRRWIYHCAIGEKTKGEKYDISPICLTMFYMSYE